MRRKCEACGTCCTYWRCKAEAREVKTTSVALCLRRNPRGIRSHKKESLAQSAPMSKHIMGVTMFQAN
jgi:uncharacterized cysteine cluster protein YcgN (CxxCxxCC family)